MEKSLPIIILIQIIVFTTIIIITFMIRINETIKLEKRISRFTIKTTKNKNNKSYYDIISTKYKKIVKKQRKKINKLFPNIARKYDKYVTDGEIRAVDYVTHKIVISILFTILTITAMIIQKRTITSLQLILCLFFGFYILDIILWLLNKFQKKKIENEMLRAIIIMNNAFKSGKSTIQAVEIASQKLPKPINLEFKRMYQEMKYGLSVDVVFDRFAKRVKIEEAEYISSSLTILNRTGGNIVLVFNSIEKTLFDKMKLKDELKNSTTVSKLLVKILIFVPILFVLIIYMLNPSYFNPFFESSLGYLLLTICIILFIIYAILLTKIIKVDY